MPQATTRNEAHTDLQAIVYRIHAVAESSVGWSGALDLLRQHFGARLAVLGHHDFVNGNGSTLYDAPRDEAFAAECERYAPRNPWFLSSVEYKPGRVMSGGELIGQRELGRTDFYRSVLKPRGLLHRLTAVIARQGAVAHYLDLHRGEDQEPFDDRQRAGLKNLLPHVQLALANWWRYRQADDLSRAMARVMDRAGHAALIVTAEGRIVLPCGEIRRGEPAAGLRVRDDIVVALSAADTRALYEAIAEVTRVDVQRDRRASRIVAITTTADSSPVMVTVHAAGEVFLATDGRSQQLAALTVHDSGTGHDPQDCALARRYDLTPAQAKVSALVYSGHSIARVAELLGVSDNTVRSHLKQIFQKTHTHGQMELVHFHAKLCPGKG